MTRLITGRGLDSRTAANAAWFIAPRCSLRSYPITLDPILKQVPAAHLKRCALIAPTTPATVALRTLCREVGKVREEN